MVGSADKGDGLGLRGRTAPDQPRIYRKVGPIDGVLARSEGLGGDVTEDETEAPGNAWYVAVHVSEGDEIGQRKGHPWLS